MNQKKNYSKDWIIIAMAIVVPSTVYSFSNSNQQEIYPLLMFAIVPVVISTLIIRTKPLIKHLVLSLYVVVCVSITIFGKKKKTIHKENIEGIWVYGYKEAMTTFEIKKNSIIIYSAVNGDILQTRQYKIIDGNILSLYSKEYDTEHWEVVNLSGDSLLILTKESNQKIKLYSKSLFLPNIP
jgi:hypothetical protein